MSTKTNRKKCLIVTILMLIGLLGTASVSLAAGDTWTAKSPMPTARAFFSASTVDGKIYAIGGMGGTSAVEEYDPATDTWTKKASLPTPRLWLSTSVVDGRIYAIGGAASAYALTLSTVEVYDPTTDTWAEKAPMLTTRFSHSTSVVDGKIYAIGGWRRPPDSLLRDVEEYDPATDTWTKKAAMPTARIAHSTSVVDGKIYAIGGAFSPGGAGLSIVEAYDPATDTWTTKAPMPTARTTFLATSVVNGIIYVIGGVSGEPAFSTVEAYDPATDTWTEKTSMPRARGFLATSVVGGKIYAIGGSFTGHGASISTVEEYDTGLTVSSPDFNGDGIVDSADMCIMVDHWHTDYPLCDIAPVPFGDGIVDAQDLAMLSEYLFEEIFPVELVGYWKLDEAEGIVAYNSVGDKDGFLFGDPVWRSTEGKKEGALEFDGIDDHVITDSVLNPADGPFSVFAWIKGGAPGQVIISQSDDIGTGEIWLGMEAVSGCLMTGLVPPPVGRFVAQPLGSQVITNDGLWHHIGFVWDDSYRALYVDGAEVSKDTEALNPLKFSNGGLYIGAGKALDTETFFSGLIDDVRIYDVVLSAEEIEILAR